MKDKSQTASGPQAWLDGTTAPPPAPPWPPGKRNTKKSTPSSSSQEWRASQASTEWRNSAQSASGPHGSNERKSQPTIPTLAMHMRKFLDLYDEEDENEQDQLKKKDENEDGKKGKKGDVKNQYDKGYNDYYNKKDYNNKWYKKDYNGKGYYDHNNYKNNKGYGYYPKKDYNLRDETSPRNKIQKEESYQKINHPSWFEEAEQREVWESESPVHEWTQWKPAWGGGWSNGYYHGSSQQHQHVIIEKRREFTTSVDFHYPKYCKTVSDEPDNNKKDKKVSIQQRDKKYEDDDKKDNIQPSTPLSSKKPGIIELKNPIIQSDLLQRSDTKIIVRESSRTKNGEIQIPGKIEIKKREISEHDGLSTPEKVSPTNSKSKKTLWIEKDSESVRNVSNSNWNKENRSGQKDAWWMHWVDQREWLPTTITQDPILKKWGQAITTRELIKDEFEYIGRFNRLLDLRDSEIQRKFITFLKSMSCLKGATFGELDLSECCVTDEALDKILLVVNEMSIKIVRFKLHKNELVDPAHSLVILHDDGREEFTFPQNALRELHLSHNKIEDAGAARLFRSIRAGNESQREGNPLRSLWLRLEWNGIMDPCNLLDQMKKEGIAIKLNNRCSRFPRTDIVLHSEFGQRQRWSEDSHGA